MEEAKSEKGEEITVREDVFTVHYQHCLPAKCQVTLTSSELILREQEDEESDSDCDSIEEEHYKITDIFGVHIVDNEREEPSHPAVYVCVIFYTCLENNAARSRVSRIFEVHQSQRSYEGNLDIAREWTLEIAKLIGSIFPNLNSHELQSSRKIASSSLTDKIDKAFDHLKSVRSESKREEVVRSNTLSRDGNASKGCGSIKLDFYEESFTLNKTLLFERHFLILLNPCSGQGKGSSQFQERVAPAFADAGIKCQFVETEFAGHAHNTVKKFDLGRIDGIVSIGGDGLLSEIVNGIRNRPDAEQFADIPIGVVATGSGNGLARSIAAYCGASKEYRANPVLYSALCIARGCVSPVNLTEVTLDKRKFYSFLSVGWGLLSDIDIESEILRYIGEIRFFIWSFIRLIQLRRYKAELSYVPHDAKGSITSRTIVNDDFVSVYSACQSWIGSDMLFAPDAEPYDTTIHLNYLPSSTGRLAAAKYLHELNAGQGQQIAVQPGKYVKVKEFTIRCEGGIQGCLTVDGEQVKGEEISAKMCDKPLFVLTMGKPEET